MINSNTRRDLRATWPAKRAMHIVGTGPLADSVGAVLAEAGYAVDSVVGNDPRDGATNSGLFAPPARMRDDVIDVNRPVDAVRQTSRLLQRVPLELLADQAILDPVDLVPRDREWYRRAKRRFDVMSALVLLLASAPLMVVIGLAIRLDSAGPAFYSQRRVGQYGKVFRMHKFRSMRVDAETSGGVYTSANDPRITRVGAMLRRTRMDELPQLINVLRGEMSIIGPRPELPGNIQVLESRLPGFSVRTAVRPGLTGWAQVRLPYASDVEATGNKLEYDLHYVINADLMFDLRIALRTVFCIFRLQGR